MWGIIGIVKPSKNIENRKKARLAFQKLWVAGTLGAFFIALAKNLPIHIAQFSFDPDLIFTMGVFLKYIYLLWFLCYFFISNVRNEHEKETSNQDLIFDIIQSTLALMSAYAIGFIVPNIDLGITAYFIANCSILVISLLSLHFYSEGAGKGVNKIRWIVVLTAFISMVTTIIFFFIERADTFLHYGILLVLSVILWLMLWPFFFIRLDREEWK